MGEGVPFGDFELIRRLGVGGMAEVFLVKRRGPEGFQKRLVIKRLLPHLNRSQTYIDLFLKEARMAALVDHPNLAHVSDFGQVDGRHYMAMEYVDGLTVSVFLDKVEKMPLGVAVRVAIDVLAGLEALHTARAINGDRLNLVHRDITPRNVMLVRGGNVKLLDLGIAVQAKEVDQQQAGTKNHMSPEQALGQAVDARADVYSVGLLVIRMLCGRVEVQHRAPHPAKPYSVPDDLWPILRTALAFEAGDRYESAKEFLRALERFAGSLGEEANRSFLAERVAEIMPSLTQVMRLDADEPDASDGAPVTQTAAPDDTRATPRSPAPRLDTEAQLHALLSEGDEDAFEQATPAELELDEQRRLADTNIDPEKVEFQEDSEEMALHATIPSLTDDHELIQTHSEGPAVPISRSDTRPIGDFGPVTSTLGETGPLPDEPRLGTSSRTGRKAMLALLTTFVVVALYFVMSYEAPAPPDATAAKAPSEIEATPELPTPEAVVESDSPEERVRPAPRRRKKARRRSTRRRRPKAPKSEPKSEPKVAAPTPRRHGFLTINTRPWTQIYIDDKRLDVTPIERARLSAGPHELRMVNEGEGIDRRTTITIEPGRVARISREF